MNDQNMSYLVLYNCNWNTIGFIQEEHLNGFQKKLGMSEESFELSKILDLIYSNIVLFLHLPFYKKKIHITEWNL